MYSSVNGIRRIQKRYKKLKKKDFERNKESKKWYKAEGE